VVSGQGRAVVFATGAHTEFGRIARLTPQAAAAEARRCAEDRPPEPQHRLLALPSARCSSPSGRHSGVPFWRDVILSLGIIIALVPEGLLPTLTLSLVLAAQRLARKNVLIRHLPSVETLAR
jgi:magnesium-transporting ATPase (P-type)